MRLPTLFHRLSFTVWLAGLALLGAGLLGGCVTPRQLAYFQADGTPTGGVPVDSLFATATNIPIIRGMILTIRVNTTGLPGAAPANPFEPIIIPGKPIDPPTTTGYLVDEQGNLALPLVGVVAAAGRTPQQLAAVLRDKLRAHLPQPTVLVQFTTRVSVLGEVARPAVFTLNNTFITLPEALGLAGDLTSYARRDNILVIRYRAGRLVSQELDLTKRGILNSPYYFLQPGDVVYVSPGKARAASVDRAYQILPIVLTSLTVIATLVGLGLTLR